MSDSLCKVSDNNKEFFLLLINGDLSSWPVRFNEFQTCQDLSLRIQDYSLCLLPVKVDFFFISNTVLEYYIRKLNKTYIVRTKYLNKNRSSLAFNNQKICTLHIWNKRGIK